MNSFLIVWRESGGLQSIRVPDVHLQHARPGMDIRVFPAGVSVNGVEMQCGTAARVDGVVMSCLKVMPVARGLCEAGLGAMVGASIASIEAMHMIAAAGLTRDPVLVLGESGTGKELAADYLGGISGSMHAVNLGAVPPELAEAEMFGWTRGAFTGAVDSREGALEAARAGVLFLDEVGEAPAWVQAKLLRALDSRKFRRLGSNRDILFQARVVAATNVDPVEGIADGRLRLDLLERLACHVIRLAPLRTRPADIPCLIRLFAVRTAGAWESGDPAVAASADVIDLMRRWPWPGNVRELGNVVRRVLLVSSSGLTDVALVREAMEAGRFFSPPEAGTGDFQENPASTRQQEIAESSLPRSTYYYRLKRGRIPADTGPRRSPSSAALKT